MAVVAAVASVAGAGVADARLVRVGPVGGGVVSDEHRWLAYVTNSHRHVRVVDTFTGRSHRIRRPRRCEFLQGYAGTRLILDCRASDGRSYPRLFSQRTGRLLRPRGAEQLRRRMIACHARQFCSASAAGWGRHWLRTEWKDNSGGSTVTTIDYTHVRSGRVRGGSPSAARIEDIDHPSLVRRLCRPARRTPVPADALADTPFQPFDYKPPFALSIVPRRFTVQRCGRSRPALVRGRAARALQLTRHHVVWQTRDRGGRARLHVMNLRSRRRRSWIVERLLGVLTIPAYEMTRDWLYVTDFRGLEERRLVLLRDRLP